MKHVFIVVIGVLCFIQSKAQIIAHPPIGFVSSDVNIHIDTVTVNDTSTNLVFTVKYKTGNHLNIPKETYIQPIGDSEKYFIRNSIGISIGNQNIIPANGEVHYTLIFSKIKPGVTSIDFGENVKEGKKIYDISLTAKQTDLPKNLYGEWYNTEDGNLEYAFYQKQIVYNNIVWKYGKTNFKNGKGTIELLNNKEKLILPISKIGNDGYLIQNKAFSKDIHQCTKIISHEKYTLPVFKLDTAFYSGCIKNYNSRIGVKTIVVYQNNVLTGVQNSFVANIDSSGSFHFKIPIYSPQQIYVRASFYVGSVYLEPGKKVFSIIDNDSTFFMGELASLNSELNFLDKEQPYNYFEAKRLISNATPDQYKNYCEQLEKKENNSLEVVYKTGTISDKAYQVKQLDIRYDNLSHLLEHQLYYRSDNNQKNDSLPLSYYSFLNNDALNNPLAIIAPNYWIFINRLKYLDTLCPKNITYSFSDILDKLNKDGYQYLPDQKLLVDSLQIIKHSDTGTRRNFYKRNNNKISDLTDAHTAIFLAVARKNYRDSCLKSLFNIDKGICSDVMFAQDVANIIVQELTPVSPAELNGLKRKITTTPISDYLDTCNQRTIAQIELNKKAGGYFVNGIPDVQADKVFDNIISKYKGKVIYIDFWATWCGPCRDGIKAIAPLKEELKGKNIVFVYITDETSPLNTWQNMIPDIKGEHYRLNKDDWNYLRGMFNIGCIPHQVLVDTNGKIINPDIVFRDPADIKKLLTKYM